jgi:hypothetical protein
VIDSLRQALPIIGHHRLDKIASLFLLVVNERSMNFERLYCLWQHIFVPRKDINGKRS